jgi:hypothetical protein
MDRLFESDHPDNPLALDGFDLQVYWLRDLIKTKGDPRTLGICSGQTFSFVMDIFVHLTSKSTTAIRD